jgi:hypothetical protein
MTQLSSGHWESFATTSVPSNSSNILFRIFPKGHKILNITQRYGNAKIAKAASHWKRNSHLLATY